MAEKLTNYDPAEDLGSDDAIAVFMAEAFQTNDAAYIAHALGVVARAKGMAQIAGQTGLSREQLYRSFSEKGNPTLKTTLAVMKARRDGYTNTRRPSGKPRSRKGGGLPGLKARPTQALVAVSGWGVWRVGVRGFPGLKIQTWVTRQ
jgi:probable addiction module antidote protein